MSFTYNPQMVFQWLNERNQLLEIFQIWFKFMDDFKKDFELRRIIFGLSAIVKTPAQFIPELIKSKLPEIMKTLASLAQQMFICREKVLIENQKDLK